MSGRADASVGGAEEKTNCKTVEQAMSVRKLTASLLTALAMLGGVASVGAQEHFPAADPFAFDPDFNWFEPVYDMDLADMKPSKRAPTGWFATYDRLNLYGSRPETDEFQTAETKLDSGYGHRYEIGYMIPGADTGWTFNWTNNDIWASSIVRREALNRYNGSQVIGGEGENDAFGAFGFDTPPGVRNNEGFSYRFYDVTDTENIARYDSYELNKTWRLEPYHYGGILEPSVGVRWMRVEDRNAFQTFEQGAVIEDTIIGPVPLPFAGEQLTTNSAITDNEMFGGQLGFRYTKTQNRFTFSGNFQAFFGGNWQNSKSQISQLTVLYDDVAIGDPPIFIDREATTPVYSRNEEFFVGFDVRGEVGYQLTKMIQVRAGFQVIDIGRGVWRGGDGTVLPGGDNDQDLLMVGGTFGLSLNH